MTSAEVRVLNFFSIGVALLVVDLCYAGWF